MNKLEGNKFVKSTIIKTDNKGISVENTINDVTYVEAWACCLALVMDLVDGDSDKLNEFFTSCIIMLANKGGDYGKKKEAFKIVDSKK